MRRAYALTFVSTEFLASDPRVARREIRSVAHAVLDRIGLVENVRYRINPFERRGDLEVPPASPGQVVVKATGDLVA